MSTPASQRIRRLLAVALFALCVAVASSSVGAIDAVNATGESTAETENRTLVVADAETDEPLLEVPTREGDEFTLAYTHSVEKTDVEDVYEIDDSALRMDRMVFSSYGAGLPSEAEVNRTEEGFVVTVDQSFERIYVSPGSIAGHTLHVDDECYALDDLSDGATVVLFVEDSSMEPSTGSAADPSTDSCGECR